MSTSPQELPPLSGDMGLRELLIHALAGNVVGYAIYCDEVDAEMARSAGVGVAVIAVCQEINKDMPEYDMELGTDLRFVDAGDIDSVVEKEAIEDDPESYLPEIPVEMTKEDVDFLLTHLPTLFLSKNAIHADGQA